MLKQNILGLATLLSVLGAGLGTGQGMAANYAIEFDGDGDYVTLGDTPTYRLTTLFTIEAWIKPTSFSHTASSGGVFINREGEYEIGVRQDGQIWWAANSDGRWQVIPVGASAPIGEWTHVALTENAGDYSIYVNGYLVQYSEGTQPITDRDTTRNELWIGWRQSGGNPFYGLVDEVRIWNRTRSSVDIRRDFRRTLTGSEAGLQGYWRLDDGEGAVAIDSSPSAKNGELKGNAKWVVSDSPVGVGDLMLGSATEISTNSAILTGELADIGAGPDVHFEWGEGATALGLDGQNDHVQIPHQNVFNGDPNNGPFLTVSAWVKLPPGATGGIVNKYVSGSQNGWQMDVRDGVLSAWYFGSSSRHVWGSGAGLIGGPIADNQWHHIAWQVDTSGGYLYVDGLLRRNLRWTGTPLRASTTEPVRIGLYPPSATGLEGLVQDVCVWRTDLSVGAIQDVMRGANYYEDFLVGRWKLDEGEGNIALDSSGNQNHGILVGNPTWMVGAREPLVYANQSGTVSGFESRNALRFVGNDGGAISTLKPDLKNRSFSVEFWAKRGRTGVFEMALGQSEGVSQNTSFTNQGLHIGWRGNDVFTFGFFFNDLNTPDAWPDLDWHHWACTYDSNTRQRRIYRDGVLVAQDISPSHFMGAGAIHLGLREFLPGNNASFAGMLRDVRLWGVALDTETIRHWKETSSLNQHPHFGELMSQWRLDRIRGTRILDFGPALNHLDVFPTSQPPTLEERRSAGYFVEGLDSGKTYFYRMVSSNSYGKTFSPALPFTTRVAGGGTALSFDGIEDIGRVVGFSEEFATGEVTVEFWQRAREARGQSVFGRSDSMNENRFSSHTPWSTGAVYWDFGNIGTGGPGRLLYTPPELPIGEWMHFALTSSRVQNRMRIFRNGILEAEKTGSSSLAAGTNLLHFAEERGLYFNGELDEFRVWTRELNEPSVRDRMHRRITGNEPDLKVAYNFDEGAGDVFYDQSPNRHHGYLRNGVRYVPSGAPIGLPRSTTGEANELEFGNPILSGMVGTGGESTRVWFEWGAGDHRDSAVDRNRVEFWDLAGTAPSSLSQIDWEAAPDREETFHEINVASVAGSFWPAGEGEFNPRELFAARFTGKLHIENSGNYLFYLSSDDGSDLWIDGTQVVDHDGLHSMSEARGATYLSAGLHEFEVRLFERSGNAGLILGYQGPGIPKQVIPAEAYVSLPVTFSQSTEPQTLTGRAVEQSLEVGLPELEPGTYFYRLVTENSHGRIYGETQTFTLTRPVEGKALRLDGFNDHVVLENSSVNLLAFPGVSPFTLETWVKVDRLEGYQAIASKFNGGVAGEYHMGVLEDGTLHFGRENAPNFGFTSSRKIVPGEWTHLAFVYDGSKRWFYFNGELDSAKVDPGSGSTPTARTRFVIGANFISNQLASFFGGQMDEFRVWNRVLSPAEIRAGYRMQPLSNANGLLAYYPFNESHGATLLDSGPDGLTALLVNGADRTASDINLFSPPLVQTSPAEPVLAITATLNGVVNPSESATVAWFRWWPVSNPSDFTETPVRSVGNGRYSQRFSETLEGLAPGETYVFQVRAGNEIDTVVGEEQTFTTLLLDCGWPVTTKTSGGANGPVHALDQNGDTIVAGTFRGSASFGSTVLQATGSSDDLFVGKLNGSGEWLWVRAVPSSLALEPSAITVDEDGAAYIAGAHVGNALFGDFSLETPPGTEEGFFVKIDTNGDWVWANSIPSASALEMKNLSVDSATQGVYLAGSFAGTARFGNLSVTSLGGMDGFVARADLNGAWDWVRGAGGASADDNVSGVVSFAGGVYVAGAFFGSASFGTTVIQSSGGSDFFLGELDSNGEWIWVNRGGGIVGDDWAVSLTRDRQGRLLLAGEGTGVVSYQGVPLNLGVPNQRNLFVAQFDEQGALKWFSQPSVGTAQAWDIDVDSSGNALLLASFLNPVTFGSSSLVSKENSRDIAVARLSEANGSWLWALGLGNGEDEVSRTLAVGADDISVLSGTYFGTVDFGRVTLTALQPEIFLARINGQGGFEYNAWTIGDAVPIPPAARAPDGGAHRLPGVTLVDVGGRTGAVWTDYFFWSNAERKLYAIRPVNLAEIEWALSDGQDAPTLTCLGRNVWPARPRIQVAGAPVDLEPAIADFPLKFQELAFAEGNGQVVNTAGARPEFQSTLEGHSVLRFLITNGNPVNLNTQATVFEVVRTVPWNASDLLEYGGIVRIGLPILDFFHDDPSGKNGYLVNALAPVDAVGSTPAYDRVSRTGPLIPVNLDTEGEADDIVVAWYAVGPKTPIAWPSRPVRYQSAWPETPPELVLASGEGSGELLPVEYPEKSVYYQENPNLGGFNPNEEHALIIGNRLYALRNDLNAGLELSEPYVLLKYRNPTSGEWAIQPWKVVAENEIYSFSYEGQAGLELPAPEPLRSLGICAESHGVTGPFYEDHNGRLYARGAGLNGGNANVVLRYFYPFRESFYGDLDGDGQVDVQPGDCLAWLDRLPGGVVGTPKDLQYAVQWPSDTPALGLGETLFSAKNGLPSVKDFASGRVIYDDGDPEGTQPLNSLVRMFNPVRERILNLPPSFQLPGEIVTRNVQGKLEFSGLPYVIRSRVLYDPLQKTLSFRGIVDESGAGEPLLLINVLSPQERDRILELSSNPTFQTAIRNLYDLTRNPNRLDLNGDGSADQALLIGLAGLRTDASSGIQTGGPIHEPLGDQVKALTAGLGLGSGYVTLVENDDPTLSLPISLKILRIVPTLYGGEIKVIKPDNIFEEKLTLRHSGDFGGDPSGLEFEWYSHPDDGFNPTVLPILTPTRTELNGWTRVQTQPSNGFGVNQITLGDGGESSLLILADNWFLVRYRGFDVGGQTPWSPWAGAPGGDRGQLAEGWVKRVLDGLNPFEARSKDFHEAETATYASMIQQAGARYEGDIAFNPSADNLNQVGLIEAYTTVLRRGSNLSINAVPPVNYGPANNALLLAAGRVADLYMLLGNEAFADAADPTIGFPTTGSEYGNTATSIFAFQNQLDSLLSEERTLLHGRDASGAPVGARPVYNRLFWNFTRGDGEVAYVQAYNITDLSGSTGEPDGTIDETDARRMFPQGHGDAWGHYLSAIDTYYRLLRDPDFTWESRSESLLLAGVPVEVDYLDERKFARAAALKAKTGAEIVDLAYRQNYVDDPAGQWQGYRDTDADRAWGVTEWAQRAGAAAYLDWVAGNALLPAEDPNPNHVGIQKIDRTTVAEFDEIISAYQTIQGLMDKADVGLNPVGLAKGVVPFDIDPSQIDQGLTHFEQIYQRAGDAVRNAVAVFNHANDLSRSLRRNQDSVNAFTRQVDDQERDYKNRLIELFGYPYAGDAAYPSGYDGPDLYHYMYVNSVDLIGDTSDRDLTFTGFYRPMSFDAGKVSHYFPEDLPNFDGGLNLPPLEVTYPFSAADFGFVPPASWGERRAPGEIQLAMSNLLQKEAALRKALKNHDVMVGRIEDHLDLLQARYDLKREDIRLANIRSGVSIAMNSVIAGATVAEAVAGAAIRTTRRLGQIAVEGVPKVVGLATDATAPLRATLLLNAEALAKPWEIASAAAKGVKAGAEAAKEAAASLTASELRAATERYEVLQSLKVLEQLLRDEAEVRVELYTLREAVNQAAGEYQAWVARGLRLIDERVAFRRNAAADTQTSRYQDMSFRIFRNDAIQKYRAQFDLAQRYTFLAATAYDFETQTLGGSSGDDFLTEIIRHRSLGQLVNGQPTTGSGLADVLARLNQNFGVLKGQLGFNNPQTRASQFSLRRELFRINDENDRAWRGVLKRARVDDLWALPEFHRYCRIFANQSDGPQPGLVIRFPTTISSGLNFFAWPLSGGDSTYDPTLFATKVRSVGVWFSDYASSSLAQEPQIYLIPIGQDILRTPSSTSLATREWRVIDQRLPVPFPINASDLNDPGWIPLNDGFGNFGAIFGDIRKFSSFSAHHDGGFNQSQTINNNRLIGRSVWNTDWMLIIRGAALLNDADEGLERFIESVSDIKISFQTYSFSGN